jgi:hypothetical protein
MDQKSSEDDFPWFKDQIKSSFKQNKKDQTEGSALLKLRNLGTAEKKLPYMARLFIKLD